MGKSKSKHKHKAKAQQAATSVVDIQGGSRVPPDHVPGTVPNLYWAAISPTGLHQQLAYVKLPALELASDDISDSQLLRFISQGSKTWNDAHVGVLSTGILPDALGFREERVARRLGCAQLAGHGRLVHAVEHLRQQPLACVARPQVLSAVCTSADSSTSPAAEQPSLTCQDACDILVSFNEPSARQRSHAPQCLNHASTHEQGSHQAQQQGSRESSHTPGDTAPAVYHMPAAAWETTDVRLMVECIQVARQGLMKIRQVWGHIQEGSALYGLMQMMPRAVVHEVGMCVLHSDHLPSHWGMPASSLPPLAASPDALIAHPICQRIVHQHSPGFSLSVLSSLIRACDAGVMPSPCPACHSQISAPQPGIANAEQVGEQQQAEGHVCWACGARAGCNRTPCTTPLVGRIDPPPLYKLKQACKQQLAALVQQHVLLQTPAHTETVDTSMSEEGQGESGEEEDVQQLGESDQADDMEEVGQADDDHLSVTCNRSSGGDARIPQEQSDAAYAAIQGQLRSGSQSLQMLTGMHPLLVLPSHTTTAAQSDAGVASPQACCTMDVSRQTHDVQDREPSSMMVEGLQLGAYMEVVEVKSTVPFKQVARKTGARGRVKVELRVGDGGPRNQVAPHWLPQLQLHMLATGCWSALLVSRSVTKGIKVFRVFRDDEYCHRMIHTVSRLYSSFVLPGRCPPVNALCGEPGYQSLMDHSIRLARSAVCVAHWQGPAPVPPGTDDRPLV